MEDTYVQMLLLILMCLKTLNALIHQHIYFTNLPCSCHPHHTTGGAELDEYTELGHEIVQRFPLHMYSKLHDITHTWVTFWKQHHYHSTTPAWSPFTTSYSDTYARIKQDVNYTMAYLLTLPLDAIAEYFGESIAFYFAYMAFYTRWLVFPSVLGVIVFAVQVCRVSMFVWLLLHICVAEGCFASSC